jgi:hypothetical protein
MFVTQDRPVISWGAVLVLSMPAGDVVDASRVAAHTTQGRAPWSQRGCTDKSRYDVRGILSVSVDKANGTSLSKAQKRNGALQIVPVRGRGGKLGLRPSHGRRNWHLQVRHHRPMV